MQNIVFRCATGSIGDREHERTSSYGDLDPTSKEAASTTATESIRFLDLVKHAPEDFIVNEIDWSGQVLTIDKR